MKARFAAQPSYRRHWQRALGVILAIMCCWTAPAAESNPSATLRPAFRTVLRDGDLRRLRAVLDGGESVNARDAKGNTPLLLAAIYADDACVKLLLERGADPNATNIAGVTALMRGAYNVETVRLLLKSGANPNVRSGMGNTALMLAARTADSHRATALLLTQGANPNATNNFGATALMAAAASGNEKTVRLLIRNGAKPGAQPAFSHEAFIFGGGRSPLMWAAFRGETGMIRALIDAGADPNDGGLLGTPLAQAAWADRVGSARELIKRGANVNLAGNQDGFTPLHWAASTEEQDPALVKLLLAKGANPNSAGGENVDAFMGALQTPLMLARRRGDTPVVAALVSAGATNVSPKTAPDSSLDSRQFSGSLDPAAIRASIARAIPLLQSTALESKKYFLLHATKQDCTSCHQQYLPMAATSRARRFQVTVDDASERSLVQMVSQGELKDLEIDFQPLFHPEPAHTKGYELLAYAESELPADESTDAWVHHLSAIQGPDGNWFNNMPRPPIQTGDIGATALAIQALQRYPLPGRSEQFERQVERARRWLLNATPHNTEARAYQILGLAWAGESKSKLRSLAKSLMQQQLTDGGWAQLPGSASDAYATGQVLYALRIGARVDSSDPVIEHGRQYLLATQLEDGTWHVRRRAFPFQPTMKSGFPHGRDSWISAAATSWAVMALSAPESRDRVSAH